MSKKFLKPILLILTLTMLFSLPVFANGNIEGMLDKAYNLIMDGEKEEAVKAYEEVYKIVKESDQDDKKKYNTAYKDLGIVYVETGEYYKAISVLEQAVPLYEDSEWLPCLYKNLAVAYYNIGEYVKAIAYADNGLAYGTSQWSGSLYEIKADSLKACGRYDEAIEHYEQMYKHNENELYYYDKLARCYEAAERYDESMENYLLIAENEKYTEGFTRNAVNVMLLKDEESTQDIVQTYLVDKLGYDNWGIACFLHDSKHYEKSLSYFEAAIEESQNDIERIYWYGSALYSAGEYEKALEIFQHVAEVDSTFNNTKTFLVYCYTELGNYEKSIEICEEILAEDQANMVALSNIRWNYIYMGKRDEAVAAMESSVLEKKADFRVSNNYIDTKKDITMEEILSIYSNLDGWPKEAKKEQVFFIIDKISKGHFTENSQKEYMTYLEQANSAYPGNYKIVSALADFYTDMGEYEKAMTLYEEAKQLNPYTKESILKKQLTVLEYIGEYEKALEINEQAMQAFPESEYFKLEKAYILIKYIKTPQEAIPIVEGVLAEDANNTSALEIMLYAYDSMKDYENALVYANKYLEEKKDCLTIKAYKAKALKSLEKEGADELIAEIESEPYSTCDTSLILANALIGNLDKVKEYLPVYLAEHSYKDNVNYFADHYYMKDAILDSEIQDILGLEVEKDVAAENVGELSKTSSLPMVGLGVAAAGLVLLVGGIVVNKKQKK